jgi:hypothetical protein
MELHLVVHHDGGKAVEAFVNKCSRAASVETLLDSVVTMAGGMVRLQVLEFLGMMVELICMAEFISNVKLE